MPKKFSSICITPAILDKPSAAQYLSLSVGLFERAVQKEIIPKPRQLTDRRVDRRVGWLRKELDAWADSRPVSSNLSVENCGKKGASHV